MLYNCVCVCVCENKAATCLSSDSPLLLWSRIITLAVSLADVAGTGPKDRLEGVKTIPTKRHELMWLINTTLIICKLHVWLHVTWEAYAACTAPPHPHPTSASYSVSKLPSMWKRASSTLQEKKQEEKRFLCVCLLSLFAHSCSLSCLPLALLLLVKFVTFHWLWCHDVCFLV